MPDEKSDPKRLNDQLTSTGIKGRPKSSLWQVRNLVDALCEEPFELEVDKEEDVSAFRAEILRRARHQGGRLDERKGELPPSPSKE